MNDTEPSAADIAAFEKDLRSEAVKVLIYNSQTSDALTRRMREDRGAGRCAGRRRDRDRTAGKGLSGVDALAARCARPGARSPLDGAIRDRARPGDDRARRAHRPRRGQRHDPPRRVHRRLWPERRRQDHAAARAPRAVAAGCGRDQGVRRQARARQPRRRLSAAAARRRRRPAAARLGFCRERLARRALGAAARSAAAAGGRWTGRSPGSRLRRSPRGGCRSSPAANCSGCCWRRRCSASRASCCSTSR